jgi:CDGSH-type Zn-finger protein
MAEVTIEATPNGPYLVTGAVELRDSDGRILPTKGKVWLCRCGAFSRPTVR